MIYRIEEIILESNAQLFPSDLTVVVGPNNGGKSQFLKDLVAIIVNPAIAKQSGLLKSIRDVRGSFVGGADAAWKSFGSDLKVDSSGNVIFDTTGASFDSAQHVRVPANEARMFAHEGADAEKSKIIIERLGVHLVGHLTTEGRLTLIKRKVNKNEGIEGPQSPIEMAFEAGDESFDWINGMLTRAFSIGLILDKGSFSEVEFRIGDSAKLPGNEVERQREIKLLPRLDLQGDGIRSFSGILVVLACTSRPIILIDEPEAFLHPPQAFLMGCAIAEWRSRGAQIFVATHSAEVLQGILSISTDAEIMRFSQKGGFYSTTKLDTKELEKITADPVLSSSRVLDGLFYRGVGVVESDGDAILYSKVLSQINDSIPIDLINSYSKQKSAQLAKPFLSMGVPCAVLVDFDILRDRGEFKACVEAMDGHWDALEKFYDRMSSAINAAGDSKQIIDTAIAKTEDVLARIKGQDVDPADQLKYLRSFFKSIRDSSSVWADLKRRGMAALPRGAEDDCRSLLEGCRTFGLFISPCGEREAWLEPNVPYTKNKSAWTERALTFLSEQPLQENHPLRLFLVQLLDYCGIK